ncbi:MULTISPECIES: tripartite tricarboxylate transporter TctB family protein [unclassified Paracoccus (in: a-proteobacteria)]|uniref:tripartite tricarboxylate transporter TctB family protein n=1 Tax=unclassified Paracoccus (in: a-proteobacteria) TaxID=2688777 RepID=UPI0012B40D5F|nr:MULTISPECIES: tripartite tricarboxylate transporter TctB family protein [unclassified Paracoccus (in: a-proteobacteria)]UXU75645.1 tripartite tricarboxylate transporter TctB family protein [Paracoccus sp. SMMA_5]UXU81550.1 tripartite tricarboxylate transporter TctB family protein [Paracoccus sp. SMMA_5_TC]
MNQPQPQSRRRPDVAALAVALGLLAIGGLMLWDSARLADLGGYSGVGPASVPRVVGLGLMALAAWTALEAWRGEFPERPAQDPVPVLWIVAGLALQLMLLKLAGFSIATGILFALTARAFGKRNLALTLPLGILFAFAVWVVFSQLLMLHLPAGPLEQLFFAGG